MPSSRQLSKLGPTFSARCRNHVLCLGIGSKRVLVLIVFRVAFLGGVNPDPRHDGHGSWHYQRSHFMHAAMLSHLDTRFWTSDISTAYTPETAPANLPRGQPAMCNGQLWTSACREAMHEQHAQLEPMASRPLPAAVKGLIPPLRAACLAGTLTKKIHRDKPASTAAIHKPSASHIQQHQRSPQ